MARNYKAKKPAGDAALRNEAIEDYFRRKAAKLPAPLKNAAFGRVKEPTLCGWVKGHATAEAALAARAAARPRGGQTRLPVDVEKALAGVIHDQWLASMTLSTEQVIAMATIEAAARGLPFQARLRARAVSWGFVLSPGDRMPPASRPPTGTSASAARTSCPGTVLAARARSTARRASARPI